SPYGPGNRSQLTTTRRNENTKGAAQTRETEYGDPTVRERSTHVARGGTQRHGLSRRADRRRHRGPECRRADQGDIGQDRCALEAGWHRQVETYPGHDLASGHSRGR